MAELAAREIPWPEVTLRLPPFSWQAKPPHWYNLPPKKGDKLPRLCSRKYIKVVCPLEEVTILAKKKCVPLTVEDVLFASRALMADARRNIPDGFLLLAAEKDRLVLQPWIDNCST